ncbi:MAG: HAD-IIA family hydrolase [Verrucomicrobiota bacterium]|nr:HAD-IIA family hydrolase [Verrucomicrobiota bacterium]MCC6822587.1 HAD-IIA family hydrolase [Limisphaerales bacterium]
MPSTLGPAPAPEKPAPLTVAGRPDTLSRRLRQIRHVALDMDGTIYSGGTLFDCTRSFLAQLTGLGIGYTFLTNNSSKSVQDYVTHLQAMGITTTAGQIYTSTNATIAFLQEAMPAIRRLFVLGTTSMRTEISAAGFSLTADSSADEPDAVVVGFDTDLNFSRLCRAAYWIKQGKPFIASHPDRICPTDVPTVWVDCGAICAALQAATGRGPDAVLGKPAPRMLYGLLQKLELRPEHLMMVGDRLYTDILMARQAGILGVLVLTGEATADAAARHSPPPDLVLPDIAALGDKLKAAHNGKLE